MAFTAPLAKEIAFAEATPLAPWPAANFIAAGTIAFNSLAGTTAEVVNAAIAAVSTLTVGAKPRRTSQLRNSSRPRTTCLDIDPEGQPNARAAWVCVLPSR